MLVEHPHLQLLAFGVILAALAAILTRFYLAARKSGRQRQLYLSASTPERLALDQQMRLDPKLRAQTVPLPAGFAVASISAVLAAFVFLALYPRVGAFILAALSLAATWHVSRRGRQSQ